MSFNDFLFNEPPVEMDVNAGRCTVLLNDKKIYEGKYVVGDMEDKVIETTRAYRVLVETLIGEIALLNPTQKRSPK